MSSCRPLALTLDLASQTASVHVAPSSTVNSQLPHIFLQLFQQLWADFSQSLDLSPYPWSSVSELCNAAQLYDLLVILIAGHFPAPLQSPTNKQLLQIIIMALQAFFEDKLNTHIQFNINIGNIIENSSSSSSTLCSDASRLLEMILLCAIHSEHREGVINHIMAMSEESQTLLMEVINDGSAVLNHSLSTSPQGSPPGSPGLSPSSSSAAAQRAQHAATNNMHDIDTISTLSLDKVNTKPTATVNSSGELEQLRRAYDSLNIDWQHRLDEELRSLREAHRKQRDEWQTQLKEVASTHASSENLLHDFRRREDDLKRELLRSQQKLSSVESDLSVCESQLHTHKEHSATLSSNIGKIMRKLEEAEADNQRLQDELQVARTAVEEYDSLKKSHAKLLKRFEEEQNKSANYAELEEQFEAYKNKATAAAASAGAHEIELLKANLAKKSEQIMRYEPLIEQLKNDNQVKAEEITELNGQIQVLKNIKSDYSDKLKLVETSLVESEKRHDAALDSLRAELSRAGSSGDSDLAAVAPALNTQALLAQINTLQTQLQQQQAACNVPAHEEQLQELNIIKSIKEQLNEKYLAECKKVRESNTKLDNLTHEFEELTRRYEFQTSQLELAQSSLTSLQSRYDSLQRSHSAASSAPVEVPQLPLEAHPDYAKLKEQHDAQLALIKQELVQLKTKVQEHELAKIEWQRLEDDLKDNVERLEKKSLEFEKLYNGANDKYKTLARDHEALKREMEQQAESAEMKVENYKSQLQQLKSEQSVKLQELNSQLSTLSSLQSTHTLLTHQHEQVSQEATLLNNKLALAQQEIQNAHERKKRELQEKDMQMAQQKEELDEAEKKISTYKSDVEKWKQKYQTLRQEFDSYEKTAQSSVDESSKKHMLEFERVEQELLHVKHEKSELALQLTHAQTQINTIKAQHANENETNKSNINALENEKTQLELQMNNYKFKYDKLLKKHDEEIDQQRQELSELTSQHDIAQQELMKLKQELRHREQEVNSLKQELISHQSSHASALSLLQSELDLTRSSLAAATAHSMSQHALDSNNTKLQHDYQVLNQKYQQQLEEKHELQMQLNNSKLLLDEVKVNLNTLQATSASDLKLIQLQLATSKEKLNDLHTVNKEYKEKLEEYEHAQHLTAQSHQAQVAALNTEINELRHKHATSVEQHTNNDSRIAQLENKIQFYHDQLSSAQNKHTELLSTQEKLNQRINEYEKEIAALQEKQQEATNSYDELLHRFQVVEKENKNLQVSVRSSAPSPADYTLLEDKLNLANTKIAAQHDSISKLMSQVQEENESFNREKNEWKKREEQLCELPNLKLELSQAQREISDLQAQLKSALDKHKELDDKSYMAMDNAHNVLKRFESLQRDHIRLQSEYDILKARTAPSSHARTGSGNTPVDATLDQALTRAMESETKLRTLMKNYKILEGKNRELTKKVRDNVKQGSSVLVTNDLQAASLEIQKREEIRVADLEATLREYRLITSAFHSLGSEFGELMSLRSTLATDSTFMPPLPIPQYKQLTNNSQPNITALSAEQFQHTATSSQYEQAKKQFQTPLRSKQ